MGLTGECDPTGSECADGVFLAARVRRRMRTLRNVMDAVVEAEGDGPVHATLYDELAPLYAVDENNESV